MMDDAGQPPAPTPAPEPARAGDRLRAAREARGMTLEQVGARTRVPLRHLEAIETADFGGLPSVTYAVGFVRSYARAVGADEVRLAHDTRIEVANTVRPTPAYQPYEIVDPSRTPSRGLLIVAGGLLVAVLVLAVLWFATSVFSGDSVETTAPPVVATVPAVTPGAAAPVTGGQVKLTANDEIWMRIYDASDRTLYTGTLKSGETYDVPQDANGPMINIGRPDKLTVTLNGSAVAPLGTGERAIKDLPIGAAALAARAAGQPVTRPSASPSTTSVPTAFAPSRASGRTRSSGSPERAARVEDATPAPAPSATAPAPTASATPAP